MRAQINHARRHISFSVSNLRSKGYSQIGKGAFSVVFAHPEAPDVAIKVGRIKNPGMDRMDGFPDFARRILAKEIHSKFFPRIYHLQWSPDRTRFICIMKRYKRAPGKLSDTVTSIRKTIESVMRIPFADTPNPRFYRALKHLAGPQYVADIHSGNVLQDEHGTPIIIDPILIRSGYEREVYA